jgi:peptidoglycan/LPS O-acetylase OafA/YrhL
VRKVVAEKSQHRDQARCGGLDVLRVTALVFVVLSHLLIVWGQRNWSHYYTIALGQAGVSIFMAISGALAASSARSPLEWLMARLSRLLPSYWIALALSFCLTAVSGYKSIGWRQVLMQFAGLGILVPPRSCVNVATWFISLLLLCYAIVCLARLTRFPMVIVSVLMSSCMFFICRGIYPLVADHALTFLVAFSILRISALDKRKALLVAAVAFGLSSAIDVRLAYTGVSLFLLSLSMGVGKINRVITFLSPMSYECFLLQGIFVVGAHQFFGRWPVPAILASLVSTLAAAWLLQQLVAALRRLYDRSPAFLGAGILR